MLKLLQMSGRYFFCAGLALFMYILLLFAPQSSGHPSGTGNPSRAPQWITRDWVVMGTYLTLHALIPPQIDPDRVAEAVIDIAREDDRRFSLYRNDSEVARVNREAGKHPVRVSREFMDLLLHSRKAWERTRGAFDITTGALSMAWGFIPGPPRWPSRRVLEEAKQQVGWRYLVIDPERQTVAFRKDGIVLDFGGNAKGYSVDRMVSRLRDLGVRHAMVNLGGEIYAMGYEDGKGEPWLVHIRSPEDTVPIGESFRIHDMAVSTSGSYARYLEWKGRRYPHIISPFTGYPVETRRVSVTVVTRRAVDADTYSTALFIGGRSVEKALGEAVPCLFVYYLERTEGGGIRRVRGRRWPPGECEG